MNKKFSIFVTIVATAISLNNVAFAQVGINKDGTAPSANTILHVKGNATNKTVKLENIPGGLQVDNYILPNTDGNSNDVLQTNGGGKVAWAPMGAGSANGGVSLGGSMATAYMVSQNMFSPHTNNCAGTEAFVAIYSGATVGYCIDKNEQSAAYWTDAQRTCLAAGKRLPEPAEWQVACDQAGALGISNMTNNWEWASNFPLPMYGGSGSGVGAAIFGDGGCDRATWHWLGYYSGNRYSGAFRCVH